MANNAGKIKTPIVDKNGKITTVWKNPEGANEPIRSALAPIAKMASLYSGREVLQSPPIELDVDDQYDFTAGDGVDQHSDIVRADIYRREDEEDGTPVYTVNGYGNREKPKEWLAFHQLDITDDLEQEAFMEKHSSTIENFMLREYDISEIEWDDDMMFTPVWSYDSNEPVSTDAALDYWDTTDATKVLNESDPGTFGSRNMWRAIAQDIEAREDVAEMSADSFFKSTEALYNDGGYYQRAMAEDDRLYEGGSGVQIVGQRALITTDRDVPADVVETIAKRTKDESVQLLAVESGKMGEAALGRVRYSTQHESVRDAIDDVLNKNILDGFAS